MLCALGAVATVKTSDTCNEWPKVASIDDFAAHQIGPANDCYWREADIGGGAASVEGLILTQSGHSQPFQKLRLCSASALTT
jgi:hypothetical protein